MFENDMARKASILSFLGDADLLVNLDLDLSRSSWKGSNLRGSNLSKVNLFGADLSKADLSYVNFNEANLSEANLSEANLKGAELVGAELAKTDLTGLKNYTVEQLSEAKLCQTKMPEGCDLDSNKDCTEVDLDARSRRMATPRPSFFRERE